MGGDETPPGSKAVAPPMTIPLVSFISKDKARPQLQVCSAALKAAVLAHFDPLTWWGTYEARAPELKELAFKLLGQPASSSCCEKNWSTYGFIHSLRRNKLTPERAEDLVYVHNNLRLLSRSTNDYLTGPSKMWDVGADEHETFDGISVLQGAELTLDEPEFEVMMIEDEAASAE